MSKYNKLRKSNQERQTVEEKQFKLASSGLNEMIVDVNNTVDVYNRSAEILNDIDDEFCKKTGLTKIDVTFLFLAVGLQIARQYLLSNDKYRVEAKQGDKMVDNALSLAPPDWKEVLTQSVPYDAIKTGIHIDKTGLGGTTHRYRTLGHDPIFGWIFGTSNIMTNSLTKTDFITTYQVKNNKIIRHYPGQTIGMLNRAMAYSKNNPKLLAVSVARQAIHFGSDYFTKQGLPIPFVASINNDFAKEMITDWHLDMYSVMRGATVSIFINSIIEAMHKLFYDGKTEIKQKMYEVRTRKVLLYSNLIASSSNLAVVALTNDFTKLDVGGASVSILRLITDTRFIYKVKKEIIEEEWYKMVVGQDYDFVSEVKKMSKKDLIKGIEIHAKADAKKMEKIENGLKHHANILKNINDGQESINEVLDVVLADKENQEAEELYGLNNEKNIADLELNEQKVLCAAIHTLLYELENPTEMQKTFYMQLSYLLHINDRKTDFDFTNLKNIDSYTDRLVILRTIMTFLYLGENSFEFVNNTKYKWMKDIVFDNDIDLIKASIEKDVTLLGSSAIFNELKQIKTSNRNSVKDALIEEKNDEVIIDESKDKDEFFDLKDIVMRYISNENEFGELLNDYKGFAKEICKQYPSLVLDTIIAVTKVKNRYLAFTTYAMYVWKGNLLSGSYFRIPYCSIDFTKIATAPAKDDNSRKLIIPFNIDNNYQEIVIEDKKITEEKLMSLLVEIHDSNCITSSTDFETELRDLSLETINYLCSMIAYVLRKEQRKMSAGYIETIKYGIDYDWEQIRNQIQNEDDYLKITNQFVNEIPYPSKKGIIKKAISEMLICNSITNFLENKNKGILTSELERSIKLLSNDIIDETEFNVLIKSAPLVIDNLSKTILEISKNNMNSDDIEEREIFEKDIEVLIEKANELKLKEKLLKKADDSLSSAKLEVKKVIFEQKVKHASFKKCPLLLPKECLPLNQSVEDIAEDAIGFGLLTSNAKGIIIGYYVPNESAMNYDDTQELIDYLHNEMDEKEGLIEVNKGVTKLGKKYVYSIRKHTLQFDDEEEISLGVRYFLNFNIQIGDKSYFFNGDFTEEGTTGAREAFALHVAMVHDYVDSSLNGWTCDPYDKEYTKGYLMNMSESKDLDEMFKEHPLSVARGFVEFICENN